MIYLAQTVGFVVAFLITTAVQAQHNHAQHHASYQSWVNKQDKGCCDNRDCGELPDADERADGGVLAVKIEGQWCPVLPHHYLKRGNVPNASVSHVCVQKQVIPGDRSPCLRLLCYQPRPGI